MDLCGFSLQAVLTAAVVGDVFGNPGKYRAAFFQVGGVAVGEGVGNAEQVGIPVISEISETPYLRTFNASILYL